MDWRARGFLDPGRWPDFPYVGGVEADVEEEWPWIVLAGRAPTDEIPWIDDEPPAHSPGTGPQIEIIHGPTSQMIIATSATEVSQPRPFATRRSWLYWILWTWTWLFDHTFGHWFPWLRRPGVKFLLGLVGVALCAVSLYLVWIGWRR